MFFVSEEFLRKYEQDGEIEQTIDVAIPVGQELFEETGGKKAHNIKARQSGGRRDDAQTGSPGE